MSTGPSYGRDFGVPAEHPTQPGYEGQPPPERRGRLFYILAAVGAVLAVILYIVIGYLLFHPQSVTTQWQRLAVMLLWLVPTVLAFILAIFRPTRGFGAGFLIASAVGLMVDLAIFVFRQLFTG